MRVLNSVQSSGRCSFGCHWPKLSRCEKMRSFARLFLVAPGAADQHVEAVLLDRFEQRDGLVAVARFERMRQAHAAARDRVFEVADDEALAHLGDAPVAELDHFGEVVAGVDMQQRERQAAVETRAAEVVPRPALERLLGQAQHHARVLAARKQQRRPLERRRGLAQDEDRFFLEPVEVGVVEFGQQLKGGARRVHAGAPEVRGGFCVCSPHSLAASFSHHQRPARKSSPTATARVHGAQPMLGKNWSCSGL